MMSTLIDFFGRCHPALVHLPIGFLLIALLFQWLARKENYVGLAIAARIGFLLGMISAALSCITGWILASGGEYDASVLEFHRWLGISVALCSAVCYLLSAKPSAPYKTGASVLLLLLVVVTGHLGGTLTHGDVFLTKGIGGDKTVAVRKPIADINRAQVFGDIVQPVLIEKCGNCHSQLKQKGGLRIDSKEWILKGGKDGAVLMPGHALESELYKRVVLDPLEEKHMPPKGKPQLTEQEIALLQWWIDGGAAFDRTVAQSRATPRIATILRTFESAPAKAPQSLLPAGDVDAVPVAVLDTLRKAGIAVVPVAANSNYVACNFVSIPNPGSKAFALLGLVKKQLVSLQVGHTDPDDNSWKLIGECTNLLRLRIEHTNMNDARLHYLSNLKQLQYLNLAGDAVSMAGVLQLKNLSQLTQLYLGETMVKGNAFRDLKKAFPRTMIDSGNYRVEELASDTQTLKFNK